LSEEEKIRRGRIELEGGEYVLEYPEHYLNQESVNQRLIEPYGIE
jgi:hypothetical protein